MDDVIRQSMLGKPLEDWSVNEVCLVLKQESWCNDDFVALVALHNISGAELRELTLKDLQTEFFVNVKRKAEDIMNHIALLDCDAFPILPESLDGSLSIPSESNTPNLSDTESYAELEDLEATVCRIMYGGAPPLAVSCSGQLSARNDSPVATSPLSARSTPTAPASDSDDEYPFSPCADAPVTWGLYVEFQKQRAIAVQASGSCLRRWLCSVCPIEPPKHDRHTKLLAKRYERVRLYGVLGVTLRTRLHAQKCGPLEIGNRYSILYQLYGEGGGSLAMGNLVNSLQAFFYWRDGTKDGKASGVPVTPFGHVARADFISYMVTLTELLPSEVFNCLVEFLREHLFSRMMMRVVEEKCRDAARTLFETWDVNKAGALRGSVVTDMVGAFNKDGDTCISVQGSLVDGAVRVQDVFQMLLGYCKKAGVSADIEGVVCKLNVCWSHAKKRECYPGTEAVQVTADDVKRALGVARPKRPVIFTGYDASPVSAVDAHALGTGQHVKHVVVYSHTAVQEALKVCKICIRKGHWLVIVCDLPEQIASDAYRSLALLIEGTPLPQMHKRFRLFLHSIPTCIPSLLSRAAVFMLQTPSHYQPSL